jgi:hypothetical protein
MKFLCLAYEEAQKLDELSPHEWQALRQEVLDYVAGLRASGRLIDARPLQRAETASTVRVRDGRRLVSDGPFAETKEQIGGFFLIEAEHLDEAIEVAARWPSARIGTIEVRPVDEDLNEDRRYAALPQNADRRSPGR